MKGNKIVFSKKKAAKQPINFVRGLWKKGHFNILYKQLMQEACQNCYSGEIFLEK